MKRILVLLLALSALHAGAQNNSAVYESITARQTFQLHGKKINGFTNDPSMPDDSLKVPTAAAVHAYVLAHAGGGGTNDWTEYDAGHGNIHIANNNSGNVGIGTTSPTAKLDVNGTFRLRNGTETDGYYLKTDNNGNGTWQPLPDLPSLEQLWGAHIDDDPNISAMGYPFSIMADALKLNGVTASGIYSVALSYSTTSASKATAMSEGNASGISSTAISAGNAVGNYSVAMSGAVALGLYSTALTGGQSYGQSSTAMGSGIASGLSSTAISGGNAKALYSVAIGENDSTDAPSISEPDAFDRIFQVGYNDGERKNAITVLRNGNVGIGPGSLVPTERFDVEGNIKSSGTVSNNNGVIQPYKVYTATLTQSGTSAPLANVLQNTIGTITYSYGSPGIFIINSASLFTVNKTVIFINGFASDNVSPQAFSGMPEPDDPTKIDVVISGLGNDMVFINLEIRVYN